MNNKSVSVIIPVYNVENYLDRCMVSVVHQTYKNLQIILVDDGSPDNCPEKCDWWARHDSRIEVIHKQNGGLSDARNAGLKEAKGEYIFFIDPDDMVSINTIAILVNKMQVYNVDMVVYRFAYMYTDGRVSAISKFDKDNKVLTRKQYISIALENKKITNHVWRRLYKRKYVQQDIFPTGHNFEDIYSMPELAKNCSRILLSDFVGYFYNVNDNGIVSNITYKNCKDHFIALSRAEKVTANLEPDLKAKARALKVIGDLIILDDMSSMNKSDKKNSALIKIIIKDIHNRRRKIHTFYKYVKSYGIKTKLKILCPTLSLYKERKYLAVPFKKIANFLIEEKLIQEFCSHKKKKNLVILGSPHHGNLGDQALRLGEYVYLRKYLPEYSIFEVPLNELKYAHKIKTYLNDNDYVSLHAGENIGTLYPGIHKEQEQVMQQFREKKFFVFPQTFFYSQDKFGKKLLMQTRKNYDDMKRFHVFTRDDYSFNLVKNTMPEIKVSLMPDMALNIRYEHDYPRDGALLLFRIDNEEKLSWQEKNQIYSILEKKFDNQIFQSDTDLYMDNLSIKQYEHEVINKLDQVAKSKIVVTDRLHGMIFAAITRTPCIVLKSKSPKVRGVYQWIKQNKYIELVDDISNLPQAIEKVMAADNSKFDRGIVDHKFKEMAKIIKSM